MIIGYWLIHFMVTAVFSAPNYKLTPKACQNVLVSDIFCIHENN